MESDWSSSLDLFLDLDRVNGIGRGIEQALRRAIRAGRLTQGSALPSSRSLARDLGVARGTVTAAYSQLAAEGYLSTRPGAAARVSWAPPRPPSPPRGWAPLGPTPRTPFPSALSDRPTRPERSTWPERPTWDFQPGRPDRSSFPRQAWARAQRHALMNAPDRVFDYGDGRGHPGLRRALADYLGRARGVDTGPERLLICNGFTEALSLICAMLRAGGATTLAVEDPSAHRCRRLAEALGLRVACVPCDREGLRADRLERSKSDAVLVTPAHQYPLGMTMSPARRTALIQWARRHDTLIIEDDYDGEFRYDRQPTGALQQLDPQHVIYVGTTSKTLAPALRLGWLSPPPGLGEILAEAKDDHDRGAGLLDQLTLAELIATGDFDRHVRRMRASYRRRRDELARALAAIRPAQPARPDSPARSAPATRPAPSGLRLAGTSAGLHALIYLPEDGPTEAELLARAVRQSIALDGLANYWHDPPRPAPQAIVVGYATPAGHAYRPALRALTQLLAQPSK